MRLPALLCTAAALAAGEAAPRPNILFVLVDDLRWDQLSCSGHPWAKTPGIDRLAEQGVRFANAFVTTPLCSPSRASFLTGQYMRRHQIVGNEKPNEVRDSSLRTSGAMLRDAGYKTALIGKWHMDGHAKPRPGWDLWTSFTGQGRYQGGVLFAEGKDAKVEGYLTDDLNRRAEAFVRAPHDRPWFLYLSHKAVHGPFEPAARHMGIYAGTGHRQVPTDDLAGKPMLRRPEGGDDKAKHSRSPTADPIELQQQRCLAAVDEGMSRLLSALQETGQLERTLVVFAGDNGYFHGEHGLGDKRAAYEESLRVPLLVRWPGVAQPGAVRSQMALNIDVAPTLLEAAGAGPEKGIQGRSLVGVLREGATTLRDSFLAEYREEDRYPRIATWEAVRTADWKLIRYPGHPGWDELYDLGQDPGELRNLVAVPGAAQRLAALRSELDRLAAAAR